MLYAIGENKIIRADNDGNSVAEVHFEKVTDGVYNVTEVLTVGNGDDDKDLDKVMRKTVDHMRKNQRKLTASDPFAKEWFEDHAESYDVYVRSKSDITSAASETAAASQAKEEPKKPAAGERSTNTADSNLKKKESNKTKNDDPNALTESDLPGKGARAFGRFLQVLCFAAMLGIAGVYVYGFATTYSDSLSEMSGSAASNSFLALSAAFVVICFLFALWILSRKKYVVDGRKTRLDTGRGIFAFAIVLIGLILSPTAISFTTSTIAAESGYTAFFEGAEAFLTTFYANAQYIVVLTIGGLIASVIRQFVGR